MTMISLTGCPPRFGTPRNPARATLGPQVAEVARRLGQPFMPWQALVADVACEIDAAGDFVYPEVVLTVPRQSGKTTLVIAKFVHRLTVMRALLGKRQRATYTAQTRQAARKKLEGDFAETLRASRSFSEIDNPKGRPSRQTDWRLSLNNGSESIRLGADSRLTIDAPSRTGSHGDTLDEAYIDEAFAHQTDDVEGGLSPAMATRRSRQMWVLSTAGDERSYYLYRKVLAGRAAVDAGVESKVAYFEWSAPDDADPSDPGVWAACSPALGHTIDVSFLAGEWEKAQRKGPEGIDTFRRAFLNQWPNPPVLGDEEFEWVIDRAVWDRLGDPLAGIVGRPAFALDMTPDRRFVSIGAAGVSTAGGVHVELVAHRDGSAWVPDRLVELVAAHNPVGVALDPKGPVGSLLPALVAAGVVVTSVDAGQMAQACGAFYDDALAETLTHLSDPVLTAAVGSATKRPLGDAWAWNRRAAGVISPLVAVTLARWLSVNSTGDDTDMVWDMEW